MGLSDRDYYRQPPEPGVSRRVATPLRLLSVNAWIIITCVAVYVIDGFLPMVDIPTGRVSWVNPDAAHLDPGRLVLGNQNMQQAPGIAWRSLQEPGRNAVVGWAEVMPMHWLTAYLHFSTLRGFLHYEFWRFIGFQFLHANFVHIAFNMFMLFVFGPIVEEHLGGKRYLAFYLLCGIFGALMYLLLNLLGFVVEMRFGTTGIPGLLFSDPSMPLVGASAGILGVIMAGAYIAPRALVYFILFPFIPIELRTLAYVMVGIALVTLFTGGQNAGGEAGHLGGAIAGYYFIRHPHHLHNFFDILGRVDPTSHHYRGAGRAIARGGPSQRWRAAVADPAEIDRILDKISREGLHSLTDEEKRDLAQASER